MKRQDIAQGLHVQEATMMSVADLEHCAMLLRAMQQPMF